MKTLYSFKTRLFSTLVALFAWTIIVPQQGDAKSELTVMTQNMYVGADVNMILTAPPAEMADWVAQFVATFTATNIRGES